MPNPFACDLTHSYDSAAKAWTARLSGRLDVSDEARALLREIPEKVWRTLCFVALRMERDGGCRVTADQIASDMAITKSQAAKRLQELSEWEYRGGKVLSADGEGYSLTPGCGNPSLPGMEVLAEKPVPEPPKAEEPPTTQDLIRELTRKLHKIPGVQVLRGNYSMVGRALATYGYEAVSEALDDLMYEFDLRDQLVPTVVDPPFTAVAVGGKILIGTRQREVCT